MISVIAYFDPARFDDDEIEKALNPNGRAEHIGAGTFFGKRLERDIQYGYSSLRYAKRAADRVRTLARRKRRRIRVEVMQ